MTINLRLSCIATLSAVALLAACKPAPPPAAPAASAAPEAAASSETRIGDLLIRSARSRETPTAGGTGVGFMSIVNDGSQDDRLIAISSQAATSVELHQMSMADGQMQMRAVNEGLAIPAGQTVELAPGGYHLMLIGLSQALVAGQTVTLELQFEKAGKGSVELAVAPLGP
ncbi:copper chaperone PCu(A)C [Nevskia sp.]|uniref:copper chaperone PCu(A)C n=1 Tax=Nevskia sp. TaxID=1929292 RepID=UPI0025DE5A6A|nr:copper chaperone PCu(A)C [Nevskia sp.]